MSEDELLKIRREMYKKASDAQVEMLKGLRGELIDRRWQIILDIDSIREMIVLALAKTEDQELKRVLTDVKVKLDEIEKLIARIPDDFIPAF
jgi:hypothetical protein